MDLVKLGGMIVVAPFVVFIQATVIVVLHLVGE